MKVMVTGGTGFLGSHAVAALLAGGHAVRLLVRTPAKVARGYEPLGLAIADVVAGDVTDPGAVDAALRSCDAALHAAAVLNGNGRALGANVEGTRNVLGAAHALGLDPIIHVSSASVFFPPLGDRITVDDPIDGTTTSYSPRIVAATMEPGRGPRRYMVGGRLLAWEDLVTLCERLTDTRLRRVPAPPSVLRAAGRLLDLVRKVVSFDYPLSYEAAVMMDQRVGCDGRATVGELGVGFRPLEETFADTLRWLAEAGHIDARIAGRLVSAPVQSA